MGKGEIELLLLGPGVNPAFTLPGGLKVGDAIKKVPMVVSFANQPDETTALAHLVLPDTHWLESWGDYAPRDGVIGLMQPTMAPIRDSRQMGDVLLGAGANRPRQRRRARGRCPGRSTGQYVRETWEAALPGQWPAALQQGGAWRDVSPAAVTVKVAPSTWLRRSSRATPAGSPCGRFPRSASTTGGAPSAPGCRRRPTR